MSKLGSFGFDGGGGGSTPSSSGLKTQSFIATPAQTDFICTLLTLTNYSQVYVGGSVMMSGDFTRIGNTIILPAQMEGTQVTVVQ